MDEYQYRIVGPVSINFGLFVGVLIVCYLAVLAGLLVRICLRVGKRRH